jgi:hypothetical protein
MLTREQKDVADVRVRSSAHTLGLDGDANPGRARERSH